MASAHSSPASSSRLPVVDDDDAFLSDSDIEFDDLSSASGSALSADDDGDVFMSDTDADADGDGDADAPDARAMTADAEAWEERHRGVEYSVLGPAELEEKQLRERRDVASMFEIQVSGLRESSVQCWRWQPGPPSVANAPRRVCAPGHGLDSALERACLRSAVSRCMLEAQAV